MILNTVRVVHVTVIISIIQTKHFISKYIYNIKHNIIIQIKTEVLDQAISNGLLQYEILQLIQKQLNIVHIIINLIVIMIN